MTLISLQHYENALNKALLENGAMSPELYDLELKPEIAYLRKSLKKDKEDYIICLTSQHYINVEENKVAMVIIAKSSNLLEGKIYINETAREKLQTLWVGENYTSNMKMMIPAFASSLDEGELAITGVRVNYSKNVKKQKKGFA